MALLVFFLVASSIGTLVAGCGLIDGKSRILILTREGDPLSLAIAQAYAETRGIPSDHIVALPIGSETGLETDLDGYRRMIAEPLEAHLALHDSKDRITTLVTTRGIPLRIGQCPDEINEFPRVCQAAAVDAALAGLGRIELSTTTTGRELGLARTPNPYFGDERSFEAYKDDEPEAALRFLVSRLTGPETPLDTESGVPASIAALFSKVETTAEVEADTAAGPTGFDWLVLDGKEDGDRSAAASVLLEPIARRLEPIADQRVCDGCAAPFRGAPAVRDAPAVPATSAAAAARPVSGVVLSESVSPESALGDSARRLAAPGLVIDLVGPTNDASGATNLTHFEAKLAAWLGSGALLVSAHLADPSIAGVARPDLQLEALARGRTIAEAHFRSVPHLGWMNVLVGDPLAVLPRKEVELEAMRVADRGAGASADSDHDGIPNAEDNCLIEPNPAQRDSDGDQIGNRCDPDVDNDGRVETSWGRIYPRDARGDLEAIALTARNGPHDPNHDLDGDGRVDDHDLALAQLWLFRAPGPSGRIPPHEFALAFEPARD